MSNTNPQTFAQGLQVSDLQALLVRALGDTQAARVISPVRAVVVKAIAAIADPVCTVDAPYPSPNASHVTIADRQRAARFREYADTLQKHIDAKNNPATAGQNWTRRRAGIMAGMRADALHMEKTQCALRGLAGLLEIGDLHADLRTLTSKSEVSALIRSDYDGSPVRDRARLLARVTGCDTPHANNAARATEEQAREVAGQIKKIANTQKIPGFFPTPDALARRMVTLLELDSDMRVLEPSAGAGHLVQALCDYARTCHLDNVRVRVIEINHTLAKLTCERFTGNSAVLVSQSDCLAFPCPERDHDAYDRVIMNPPFENGQDVRHVRHVYDLLKPGGRIVAIMGEHAFFSMDKTSRDFRDWLKMRGTSEQLPAGTFLSSDRATSVATRLVIIGKPHHETRQEQTT